MLLFNENKKPYLSPKPLELMQSLGKIAFFARFSALSKLNLQNLKFGLHRKMPGGHEHLGSRGTHLLP